jgi:hypothetical protein
MGKSQVDLLGTLSDAPYKGDLLRRRGEQISALLVKSIHSSHRRLGISQELIYPKTEDAFNSPLFLKGGRGDFLKIWVNYYL